MTDAAPAPAINLDGHIPVLDGIRGLAVALVVWMHFTVTYELFGPLLQTYYSFVWMGWSGVDMFFVLSGFLITGILLKTKTSPRYFRSFYGRRVLRIFPAFYLLIILTLVVVPQFRFFEGWNYFWMDRVRFGDSWWYWAYLSNVFAGINGDFQHLFLSVTWSLCIEEHYYLFWPLVVLLFDRPALKRVCIAIIFGALALRIILLLLGVNGTMVYAFTLCRLDGLATGSLLAMLTREKDGVARLAGHARRLFPATLGIVLAIIAVIRIQYKVPPEGLIYHPLMQTLGYTSLTLMFGAVLVLALAARPTALHARFFNSGVMTWLGKYSYAIYLYNMPARWFTTNFLLDPNDPSRFPDMGSRLLAQVMYYVIASIVVCAAAYASWILIEDRCLKLKKKFPY